MCPFCGGAWVTFAKGRGTHRCNACGLLDATPDEYARWDKPDLPLNEAELATVRMASRPARIVVRRLLATLDERAA